EPDDQARDDAQQQPDEHEEAAEDGGHDERAEALHVPSLGEGGLTALHHRQAGPDDAVLEGEPHERGDAPQHHPEDEAAEAEVAAAVHRELDAAEDQLADEHHEGDEDEGPGVLAELPPGVAEGRADLGRLRFRATVSGRYRWRWWRRRRVIAHAVPLQGS